MERLEMLMEAVKEERVKDLVDKVPCKELPFKVACLLPGEGKIHWEFIPNQVCLADSRQPGDYATVSDWRKLVEYFAHQFGGLVVWEDDAAEDEI